MGTRISEIAILNVKKRYKRSLTSTGADLHSSAISCRQRLEDQLPCENQVKLTRARECARLNIPLKVDPALSSLSDSHPALA